MDKQKRQTHIDELDQIHKILLKILLDFDRLCREQNIHYFLGGGTLLGAVRHGGFIPWDDDVDVMMKREDYDKLCNLPQSVIPSGLFLQTYKSDPYYHGDMAKIRLEHTVYSTEFSSQFEKMHNGFFIDIFAHDKTSGRKSFQKLHQFVTRFCRSAVFHKWEQTPMQYYGKYRIICRLVTFLNHFLPIKFWEWLRERCFLFYNNSNTGFLYDGMGQHLSHGVFPETWLDHTIYLTFEGYQFPVPEKYREYLTFSYGDYMKIPRENERTYHKIYKIDYGRYK